MALETGTRVGVYEVTGKLGEGGMGEVYRAHDTTLDRDVALKVLSEAFTADPDRLARFQREAKVLASLNHPNIGGIHGLESAGETQALVLELIEGPTLADRIAEGPIPVDDALAIATQIAEALEAAHERGIVHRDLKPANVKVRPDGTVKVLDFGLAKAVTADGGVSSGSGAPTMSITGATQMGMVVGTAAYMAPEQARGKPVDQRADVWAFGVVLLEMLTGQRVFQGDDVSLTLAKVLEGEPKWETLPEGVPPRVAKLLRRCLEKNPKQRMHAVGDVRLAIGGAFETEASTAAVPRTLSLQVWQQPKPLVAGALALLLVGGLSVWWLMRPGPAPVEPVARFSLPLGSGQDFTRAGRHIVALAPDGDYVVYVANNQLFVRHLDQLQATAIPGTQSNSSSPFVSSDGEWIGFFADGQLRKIAVSGGAPVTLSDARNPWGASWGADDMILFGQGPDGIWQVPGTGGTAEMLIAVEEGQQAHGPQMLPGNEWVLFTLRLAGGAGWNGAEIVMESVVTGERVVLIEGGRDAHYVETGHLVYALNGVLFAVAFDLDARAVLGGPVPLVEGVRDSVNFSGATQFSLGRNGSLVYVPGAGGSVRTFVWVDRDGREEPLSLPPRAYFNPRLSPDGTRIAVTVDEQGRDLWVFDATSAAGLRLTNGDTTNAPVWTPDGERVVFSSNAASINDVYWVPADGSGEPEQLTESDLNDVSTSVTPDGTKVLFARVDVVGGSREVWESGFEGESTPVPVLQGEFERGNAEVSPDGNWLAYRSNQSGQLEIYLQPYPGPGRTVPVSIGGGDLVLWSIDGLELHYRNAGSVMSVDVNADGTVGTPVELFNGNYIVSPNGVRQYHVAPDGRFLMMRQAASTTDNDTSTQVVLVQNWFDELKERVPIP